MTSDPGMRAVRAVMFAVVCVLLAALGHIVMSGSPVPWWALSAALAVVAAAAWTAASRERGLPAVTGAAVVVQAGLHLLFAFSQSRSGPSPSKTTSTTSFARLWAEHLTCGTIRPGGMSVAEAERLVTVAGLGGRLHSPPPGTPLDGMEEAVGRAGQMISGGGDGAAASHHLGGMSPAGMLLAHLLAAVLCGLWLAYGERSAFRILRALAGRLLAPLRMLPRPAMCCEGPRVRRRALGTTGPLRRLLLAHSITSRGPPAVAAVV
ncbi:hypothetical protein [Streptomyces sp. NPDC088146]|uniref:hypothetical protein n=1 Tax=Streptomyces sp. NPDC088146 TaxID=3365829 RepID=UPI003825B45B